MERIEDWTGAEHEGEPFFYYLYRCRLYRGDLLIAEGDASCNSRETKYRWRESQRLCPACGAAAIIKGREEYGGGWVCFRKKGGCGAKYPDGDQAIETQPTGRVFNPDIADQVNTIQKMAQKRALVASVLLAVNASEFFTQDVEDMAIGTTPVNADASAAPSDSTNVRAPERGEGRTPAATSFARAPKAGGGVEVLEEIRAACRALGKTEAQLAAWVSKKYSGASGVEELTDADRREVLSMLRGLVAKRAAA